MDNVLEIGVTNIQFHQMKNEVQNEDEQIMGKEKEKGED
jgi:hypothetical protein